MSEDQLREMDTADLLELVAGNDTPAVREIARRLAAVLDAWVAIGDTLDPGGRFDHE